MKKVMRKIFRYPAVDGYMFFACIIAFVALFISLSVFNEAWDYEDDESHLKFMSSYQGELIKTEKLDLSGLAEGVDCNASFSDVRVSLRTQEGDYNTEAQIYLKMKDRIYPLIEGRYPEDVSDDGPVCVVGREIAEMTGSKTNDHIWIDGSEYKISGIIGTDHSDYLDWHILLWYDKLTEKTLEHLRFFDTVGLIFESNDTDTYICYRKVYDALQGTDGFISLKGTGSYTDTDFGKSRTEAWFYFLLYGFALLHCVVASDIWIYERKYEISVKKAVGFSSGQLKKDLYVQLISITAFAAFMCVVLQGVFMMFGTTLLGIRLRLTWKNLLLISVFTMITSIVGLWRHIGKLDKKEAVNSLRNRSDGI